MTSNEIRSINRLGQRLAVRIEPTFRPDGKLADDLSLYRQFRHDHGEQLDQDCVAPVEKALGSLLDRVHVNRASLVVAPFHGNPATDRAGDHSSRRKPNGGNGAEQAHLNF